MQRFQLGAPFGVLLGVALTWYFGGTVGTGCIRDLGPEKTGGWIQPGDVIELEIERLETQTMPII